MTVPCRLLPRQAVLDLLLVLLCRGLARFKYAQDNIWLRQDRCSRFGRSRWHLWSRRPVRPHRPVSSLAVHRHLLSVLLCSGLARLRYYAQDNIWLSQTSAADSVGPGGRHLRPGQPALRPVRPHLHHRCECDGYPVRIPSVIVSESPLNHDVCVQGLLQS